jgi:hypothetical protein
MIAWKASIQLRDTQVYSIAVRHVRIGTRMEAMQPNRQAAAEKAPQGEKPRSALLLWKPVFDVDLRLIHASFGIG